MKSPEPPTYVIQPDPLQQQADQQAKADQLAALQDRLKGDTASIMTRYGAMLTQSSASSAMATSSPAAPSLPSDAPAMVALVKQAGLRL